MNLLYFKYKLNSALQLIHNNKTTYLQQIYNKKLKNSMEKEDLLKLKQNLPKGFRQQLAEDHKVTLSYIDLVLNGKRDNLDIIESAIEIAKKHKQKKNSISQQINKL